MADRLIRCALCRRKGHSLHDCEYLPPSLRDDDPLSVVPVSAEERRKIGEELRKEFQSARETVPFAPDLAILLAVMEDEEVRTYERTVCGEALKYYLDPLDAIPDAIPVIGYADDAVVAYLALSAVLDVVTDKHLAEAERLHSAHM